MYVRDKVIAAAKGAGAGPRAGAGPLRPAPERQRGRRGPRRAAHRLRGLHPERAGHGRGPVLAERDEELPAGDALRLPLLLACAVRSSRKGTTISFLACSAERVA